MNAFLILASISHAIFSLIAHNKLTFGPLTGFFGRDQWVRKFADIEGTFITAPNNLYYKTFRIRYKEAFPLSATALAWITDAYHFFQFITIKLVILAMLTYQTTVNPFIDFFLLWAQWSVMFEATYSQLPKLLVYLKLKN